MADKIRQLQKELGTIIKGKKEVTDKIIMAVLARGHVLLEDVPGVGKTTTALALCRLMGMDFNRIQFTPDVVPSDVTGFTMYEKQTGKFIYRPGAVMCNMLLADEINRTSSKTQAALLEVMEEGKVTVGNGRWCDTPAAKSVYRSGNTEPGWFCRNTDAAGIPVGPIYDKPFHGLSGSRKPGRAASGPADHKSAGESNSGYYQRRSCYASGSGTKSIYGRFHLELYCNPCRGNQKPSYDYTWS